MYWTFPVLPKAAVGAGSPTRRPWPLSASFPLAPPPGDCRDTLVCGYCILGAAAVSLSFAASPGPRGVVVPAHTAGLKGVLTAQVWSVCTGFIVPSQLWGQRRVAAERGDLRVEFCAWRSSLWIWSICHLPLGSRFCTRQTQTSLLLTCLFPVAGPHPSHPEGRTLTIVILSCLKSLCVW